MLTFEPPPKIGVILSGSLKSLSARWSVFFECRTPVVLHGLASRTTWSVAKFGHLDILADWELAWHGRAELLGRWRCRLIRNWKGEVSCW